MCSRVTTVMAGLLARGSLPCAAFPVSQWRILALGSPLTVAGAAAASAEAFTAFPFNPRREPSARTLAGAPAPRQSAASPSHHVRDDDRNQDRNAEDTEEQVPGTHGRHLKGPVADGQADRLSLGQLTAALGVESTLFLRHRFTIVRRRLASATCARPGQSPGFVLPTLAAHQKNTLTATTAIRIAAPRQARNRFQGPSAR